MDVVVVLCGQPSVLEPQAAVVYPCTDRRREPLADSEAVRRFQPSEHVLTTERGAEKSGRASGYADKPVATSANRKYHSIKIDRLDLFCSNIMGRVSYSVLLFGLAICPCLYRAK